MARIKLLHKQNGGILVIAAASLVALIGVTALSIDLGQMYIARQQAQNVCDAAALAGVRLLTGNADSTEATAPPTVTALDCIDANNAETQSWQLQGYEITFPTSVEYANNPAVSVAVEHGEAIKVTGHVNVNFAFAGIFGILSRDVHASATALLRPAARLALDNMIPVGFLNDDLEGLEFGDQPAFGTVGDWTEGGIGAGNWLSLRFEGDNGVNIYIDRLRGVSDPVTVSIGDPIHTQTGGATGEGMSSKTYEGLVGKFNPAGKMLSAGRLNLETDPLYKPTDIYTGYNPDAWENWKASKDAATGLYDSTNRIVILPVVEGTSTGTSTELKIVGFAAFFIVRVYDGLTPDTNGVIRAKGDIEGHFIQAISGEQGNNAGWVFESEGTLEDDPYGVRYVRLIN